MSDEFWRSWEKSKRRELRAEGMTRDEAKRAAHFEGRNRKKVSKLVGLEAAAAHELIIENFEDGRYRTLFKVPVSAIPSEYLARAEAWAEGPSPTMQ